MLMTWRVTVDTKAGPETLHGRETFDWGDTLRVTADLPVGVIRDVTARIPVAVLDSDRIFMNGYQTWTSCPEYGVGDRIWDLSRVPPATLRKYDFDRYGDYHFVRYPRTHGITHGHSYCYFRRGGTYRLIGTLDETPGYTLFEYDAAVASLTVRRDCSGVKCGGEYHLFDLCTAIGDEDRVFDAWFSAAGIAPLPAPKLKGYTSWYNRYEDIDEAAIRNDLDGCKTLLSPGDLFQIDDGWEPAVGDWLEADGTKFPNGLSPIVEDIHASGFKAGLWLAPLAVRKDSKTAREHPEWLLTHGGKPWSLGSNWGGFYALDIDVPQVTEHLERVFDRVIREWGFDLLKLDFLYAAAPFGTDSETRAARMTRAADLLRRLCGDRAILGCGVPVFPSFGRFEYCRVSCDVSLDWDDKPFMRLCHRERVSTKHAILNTLYRRELNGRAHLNDPDVFFLRDDNIDLLPEQKRLLAELNALFGGVLLMSDDVNAYTDAQRDAYAYIRSLSENAENVRFHPDEFKVTYTLDGEDRAINIPREWF